MMEEDTPGAGPSAHQSIPPLSHDDLQRTVQVIEGLYDAQTAGQPALADELQKALQGIQSTPPAWGLVAGLSSHENPNVRFFGAHTAQVKISRDWDTLPRELQPALLQILLEVLGNAVAPDKPYSYQPGNGAVVRKIFGAIASLLLRLPFHLFPSPLLTVLSTISSAATSASLPSSHAGSGFSTPGASTPYDPAVGRRMRTWGLEWLGICVEEIARAGISDQKRNALRKHLEVDLPQIMDTIRGSLNPSSLHGLGSQAELETEAIAACKCAEAWVNYGLGADELTSLLPCLYNLLPLPAASLALVEILGESIFRFGKGTKVLTEPLLAWSIGPGKAIVEKAAGADSSDEVLDFVKLLCALIEHSSEWLVARIQQEDVQQFLALVLRLTAWEGVGGVEESISELTLPIYPLLQEGIMDSEFFSEPHETSPQWQVAKHFFTELVSITRRKVRWPDGPESSTLLGGLDKSDREGFATWRRDAGEVIVCAYYILRDDILGSLVHAAREAVNSHASWQDIEAILHCIRYSAEGVPLGEERDLPVLFGQVLGGIGQRQSGGRGGGRGETRLRLTTVLTIQAYEEWFKFHPDLLVPVLSFLVPTLISARPSSSLSRGAADALGALCDICRNKLVQHIGSFSELHGKIGDLGPEEQIKVIQGITSVIQALTPTEAVGPIESIILPIVDRLAHAAQSGDPKNMIKSMSALTACFRGLSPSDDDMFDLETEDTSDERDKAVLVVRDEPRVVALRQKIESTVQAVVQVWNGDSEVADAISDLLKNSILSSSPTLVSLSPLPLLGLVTSAAERSPSFLWFSLASTVVLRINSPPSFLTTKKDRSPVEDEAHKAEEVERWNVVGDAGSRLVVIASQMISSQEGIRDHPDIVESWFKFCGAMASRFPGILMRLPRELLEVYVGLGVIGLGAQERFSLKSTCDFFISLMAITKYPSPLEESTSSLLHHFGPRILRAILLSAGSEGPRSIIPNLAELLAAFVQRVPGIEVGQWMNQIMAEDGFPDWRATDDAKERLKDVVTRSRTTKKMREALNEFALVSRGLANTTYGNATIM